VQPAPAALRSASLDARRLDLQTITVRKIVLDASERAFARLSGVDVSGQILVEVVAGFGSDAPPPRWEMKSLIGDVPSLLLTTAGHPMPCARDEIAQTLPGASPAQLLDAHRDALALLEEDGVPIRDVVDAAATSVVAQRILGQPAREARWATVRVLRANVRAGRDECVGLLRDRPGASDRR
jgi:hypothetical protein